MALKLTLLKPLESGLDDRLPTDILGAFSFKVKLGFLGSSALKEDGGLEVPPRVEGGPLVILGPLSTYF